MKKKLLLLFALIAACIALVGLLTVSSSAETEGDYTYTVSNGEATITGVGTFSSGDITIPSTLGGYPVTSIGDEAFVGANLGAVEIPEGITYIGANAFYDCRGLLLIKLPSTIESIHSSAFNYTEYYNDESNWENGVLYVGKYLIQAKPTLAGDYAVKDGTLCIADFAFENCTSLVSVTIPDSVTSIGDYAFEFCSSLTDIVISDSVTSIGDHAFSGCTGLTSITISDSVTSIGYSAFYNCTGVTSITIGNGVESIGFSAFEGCTSLTSITFGENSKLTSIGELAFYNTGYYNNSSNWENGVLYIGKHLIKAKYTLPGAYSIKEGTLCIGSCAFLGCTSLTSVTIPGSVSSIGSSAFDGCTSLTSITIPDSVTSIGYQAFYNCTGLTSVTFGENGKLTSISSYAFRGCTSLSSITIPGSVSSIGYRAFEDCTSLETVYYHGTKAQWVLLGVSLPAGTEVICLQTYTFVDEDGTVLKQETCPVGTTIVAPTNPTKQGNAQYSHPFLGWDGFAAGMTLTEDVTFTAKYDTVVNQYTYTFLDEDGTELKNVTVEYGTTIVAPENPSKDKTQQYTYTFRGFEGFTAGMTLTEDVTFTAKYDTKVNQYTYTFLDEDGTELKSVTVEYGTTIVAPENPSKEKTQQYTYTFRGFEGFTAGMTLTEDVTFTAEYDTKVNQYTYTFLDEDGTELKKLTANYGTTIVAPTNPTKQGNAQYSHPFLGWDGFAAGMTLTEDVTFTAEYDTKVNQYTYTFYAEDGLTVLKQKTVDYGTLIIAPEVEPIVDKMYIYVPYFARFENGATVTKDVSFVLGYAQTMNQYTYTFLDEDGVTVLKMQKAQYGTMITAPEAPTKADEGIYKYIFSGFDGFADGMILTENVTFTATYRAERNGVLTLSNTTFKTAWGFEFVTSVTATQREGMGGIFTLVLDPFAASLLSFEAAEGVMVSAEENALRVQVDRAVEEGEALITLTMKASEFLPTGETVFLTLGENETATAVFAPIVIFNMGDVNMDGTVNTVDALYVQQHAVGLRVLSAVQLAYAEAMVDGTVNTVDALRIQQKAVGMAGVNLGERYTVSFATEPEKEIVFTVEKGNAFTQVPEAPEGYAWSESETEYIAPDFEAIAQDKKYYLVKEEN